jgi:prepilin-type N-terminal cleavage/methylation domain-containing protein
MASPNTLRPNKGFTLIEVLIAIAILVVVFSLGLFISFDFYKSFSAQSEKEVIVSMLQKARSLSMNNINQEKHGVRFTDNPLTYTIFPDELAIKAAYGISITTPALPFEVTFDQLSGNSQNQTIILNHGETITITEQGKIDW